MKKIFTIICISLLICGCTTNKNNDNTNNNTNTNTDTSDQEFTYIDGEYTETVNGYGGEFDLTVTIKDDTITNVVFSENNETPSIGGIAVEKMKDNILSSQFETPDMVSGATITCNSIIEAFNKIKVAATK